MSNVTQQKNHGKLVSIILFVTIAIAATAIYFGFFEHHRFATAQNIKINGLFLPNPQEIVDFQLTDNKGNSFTKANLKGHWTLLFFGFTNCGFVCPTTMASLNKMYRGLQEQLPDAKLPQVVMVSVDPERDTVKRMNSYVTSFNPHFIGARGDESATDALEKQMHIAAAKIEVKGQGKNHYTIDHTAEIIVINPDAKVQAFLSYPHQPDQMMNDYKLILMAT